MDYTDSGFDENLMRAGELQAVPNVQYDMANVGELLGASSLPLDTIGVLAGAVNSNGDWINDLISATLNSQTKQILAEYTFGASGAIAIATDANNGLWLSPTGILGKKASATTFALDNAGNATFGGILVAAHGTLGDLTVGSNAWHVDASGNMWWGSSSTFAGATISISAAGVVAFTSGSYRGSLNADDITAGTYVGLTFKATGGAGADVWVQNDGTLSFRSGSSQKGYLFMSSSTQLLLHGNDDVFIDADSNGYFHADGFLALSAHNEVNIEYNSNGGTDSFLIYSNGSNKLQITSAGVLLTASDISAGGDVSGSAISGSSFYAGGTRGKSGTSTYGFVTAVESSRAKWREFTVKEGIMTSVGSESGWG